MIHELLEQLDPDTSYFSFSSTPFDPVSVVDSTFSVSNADTLLSIDLESMKADLFAALKDFEADSAGTAEFEEQFKGYTLITRILLVVQC